MIADFLTVKREYAPLIDLALGGLGAALRRARHAETGASAGGPRHIVIGTRQFLPLVSLPKEAEGEQDPIVQALRANRLVQVSLLSRVKAGRCRGAVA